MPFTTSHPALIIPLKRLFPRYVSLTGLMAGAMSPDLLYFLMGITTDRGMSHSWLGLFIFCLPAGLAFSFAFHYLFKKEAIRHLPSPFDHKLSGLAERSFCVTTAKSWLILISSVLIGALSHFLWDSITHFDGEIVRMIPWLTTKVTFLEINRPLTRWLQHLSTIIGGLVVWRAMFSQRYTPAPVKTESGQSALSKLRFWSGCAIFAALFSFAVVYYYNIDQNWQIEKGHDRTLAFMSAGLASWAGAFYAVCLTTILKRLKAR